MQHRVSIVPDGPLVIGGYALYAPIASGKMATVHFGRALATGQDGAVLAIKRLHAPLVADPELVTMFLEEARLTQQIRHENVTRTLDVVATDDEVLVVMEHVYGDSLSRLLRTSAPPPFTVIARVLVDALRGLHAAHEALDPQGDKLHILHRDVSAQNILVDTDGVAKLIDFGVAKAAAQLEQTRDGEASDKIAYTPPEQLHGLPVTPRSDVYSAGVLLWELLTSRRLFDDGAAGVPVTRILRGNIPRPKEVWARDVQHAPASLASLSAEQLDELDRIAMRALALAPRERHASAREMAFDLEQAVSPAPRTEVGEWIADAARDHLSTRGERIAEITSGVLDYGRMSSAPPTQVLPPRLLPIIIADLAGESDRDFLDVIAESHGMVLVPLVSAPIDSDEHVLEVHIPSEPEPSLFYAKPMGPPEPGGFPLTLRPYGLPVSSARKWDDPKMQVEARTFSTQALSTGHTRDPSMVGAGVPVEASVLGRTLAGGRLEIEARIGAGGGGSVYRARHRDLKRAVVAVKVLHDGAQHDLAFCERFHAEARAASRLDHPNLTRVIDFGQEPDGLLYLTMEHLDGPSVQDLITKERRVPMERAVEIMLQVCAGLAHAHAQDIVHRDIKPANVVLVAKKDDDGRPIEVAKVCDFGIALQRATDGATSSAPRVAGTPQYMSPEQCRGVDVDGRSDIYSCGVMLYELVTGELPLLAMNEAQLIQLHISAAPTPPSTYLRDIDPLLEKVILKMLAKQPENRYESMAALRNALKELLEPAFVPDTTARPPARTLSAHDAVTLAAEIARDPRAYMSAFTELRAKPQALAKRTERLEPALSVLATRGNVSALAVIVRALVALHDSEPAEDEQQAADVASPAACARRLLHAIADPKTLTPIAQELLAGSATGDGALALLRWGQGAGAHALYNARTKVSYGAARARFVGAMRSLGSPAVPVIRAGLEALLPQTHALVADSLLAADLFECVPDVHDEAMGTVIARYVRAAEPELASTAVILLARLWGERAKPLLLGSLQSPDDGVRDAAVAALQRLGDVGAVVERKIEGVRVGRMSERPR